MSKSQVSLECTEVDSNGTWTEACLSVDRDGEPDPELACQVLLLTPAEMAAAYYRMQVHYATGAWSTGTVQR